ncbi:MAG: hypothetical protein AB1831_16145 [Pseudomonadota bacterium]
MQTTVPIPHSFRLTGRRFIWLTAAWLTLSALVLYFLGDDEVTRVAGSAVAVIVCGLMFAFFADDKFDMFSPAFFWGMNFAVFYGVAAILPFAMTPEQGSYHYVFTLGRPYYPLAALVTLFCMLFFFAGYRSKWAAQRGKRITWFVGRTAPENNLRLFWAILLGMGIAAFLALIAGGGFNQSTTEIQSPLFYSAAGFLQTGLFVAVPFAVALALQQGAKAFWKLAAIISIGTALLFGLPSGSKTLALLGLMLLAFAWNYCRRRFSRKQALIAVFAVMGVLAVLMPFNSVYRDVLLSDSTQASQGLATNFAMMKDAVTELGERDPETLIDLTVGYTSQRLSNLSIVAVLLGHQRLHNDLALGDTYFRLVYVLIPRFIWPEKPPLTFGREVAVKLGLGRSEGRVLGIEMSNTSVGLTFVGEAIYNFSIYLAPLFMLLMGMFYRWLYEAIKAQQPDSGALAVAIACFAWYTLVFTAHESHLAALFAGAIKFGMFLWLLQRLFKFRRQVL